MNKAAQRFNGWRSTGWRFTASALVAAAVSANPAGSDPRQNFGPYNAVFLAGGIGITHPLAADAELLRAGAAWSLSGWLRVDRSDGGPLLLASIGDSTAADCRCLQVDSGHLQLRAGTDAPLSAQLELARGSWHFVAATFDGRSAHLYVDGEEAAARALSMAAATPVLRIAPEFADDATGARHFGGAVAGFALDDQALDAATVRARYESRPDFGLIPFQQVGVGWPWQEHAWRGLQEPQPAWTLPHGKGPFSATAVAPAALAAARESPLQPAGPQSWTINAWKLAAAPQIDDSPQHLSMPGYADSNDLHWYRAIVPGTVLTTLIANGVYPDPDIGLNNLAIPESLSRQDYWYRTEFPAPAALSGGRLWLSFNGINYAAEVWLNGRRLGNVRGAFIRGVFDVSAQINRGGVNALAVRISPPPHPGIPHEQSVAAGPGDNGGNLALDGPTFIASEGWDWIPAIRDRNSGLWQDVQLHATGELRLLDPQIISHMPLPRTDSADLDIRVPVENTGSTPVQATVEADVDDIHVRKQVRLNPGITELRLEPAEFPALHILQPKLWWPNGYGRPELHELRLAVLAQGMASDSRTVRFGIREITYELSLFDHSGRLRRVVVDPAAGSVRGEQLVDVRHEAIKRTATGWAESLSAAGETSPAVVDVPTTALTPYLAIRVNGVPIAARGGSWGTDDSRKRIGRTHLEPYFRLERAAHLNIIRNWLGQNTEDIFYDLADEYGLLVLNDFWASTQDFQLEPQDPQLFLQNAVDVIRRYRNHPSIAVWFGRNEGVPQPIINEGLSELVATLDGTRYYTGSSNSVNLQGSGPYNWRPPEQYFTELARGFSVEVGTPSLASLESLRTMIPEADRWPLGDTYAYHDWHFGGNGDTASFIQALTRDLGAPTGLEDFERKAQLMNYVSYRAIFEGFQAGLWTRNSGRLLWMTHPSWPSNAWQIYTSDYDTAAAYYAVAKACEPLHAQLNLPDYRVAVVNTTRAAQPGLRLHSRVLALDGRVLSERIERVDAPANAVATLDPLPLPAALAAQGTVLVALTLTDAGGQLLSSNIYWESGSGDNQKRLAKLPAQPLSMSARASTGAGAIESAVTIRIANRGPTPALLARLTLVDKSGKAVLPGYYSDNYLTLLPGDSTVVTAHCPAPANRCSRITLRGWNVPAASVPITASDH